MSNVAALRATDPFEARNLSLIKRTVATDCNDAEFDLFIHTAQHLRLDPLRKQIYAFVFSKDDAARRKMSIITAIGGFRTIADRTGNYLPDENPPVYAIDESLVSDINPIGLISSTVRVRKHSHGEWHWVSETAWWSEYAPIKDSAEGGYRYEDTGEFWKDTGKPKKRKVAIGDVKPMLDTSGNWGKMPHVMLAKVAEALTLRKAWPDDFAGVYVAEEMDATRFRDLTPSEAAAAGATDERLERIGHKDTILMGWADAKLVPVPVGQIADRAMAFIKEHREEPSTIMQWREQNRHGLKEFWARSPSDALAVKKEIEAALAVPA